MLSNTCYSTDVVAGGASIILKGEGKKMSLAEGLVMFTPKGRVDGLVILGDLKNTYSQKLPPAHFSFTGGLFEGCRPFPA